MSRALVRFVVATFRLRISHAQPKGCAYGKPALALLAVLLVSCSSLRAETSATDFEAANKLFEQGRFADAASAYEKLLTNGPASAAIHFNLGNAHFKSGQPGKAIFHYHQALRLAPRDPDIRANLQFARKSLGGAEETQPGRQLLRALTPDEWAWLAGAALGAWFLMLALGEALSAKRAAFAWLIKAIGTAAIFLTALFFAAHQERSSTHVAVVVTAEAPMRPGPLAESKPTHSLRNGAEVIVLDSKDDWLQVRDSSQRSGWLKREVLWQVP